MGSAVKLALFLAASGWTLAGIKGKYLSGCFHLFISHCAGFQVSLDVSKMLSDLLEAVASTKGALSSATITNGELSVMIPMVEEMQL